MKKLIYSLCLISVLGNFAHAEEDKRGFLGTYKIVSQDSSDIYSLGIFSDSLFKNRATVTIIAGEKLVNCKGEFKADRTASKEKMTVFLGCTNGDHFQLQLKPVVRLFNMAKDSTSYISGRVVRIGEDSKEWSQFDVVKQD